EDEQVAAQLPRCARDVRRLRGRCDALVPDELADHARRQPDRGRAPDPRLGPPDGAAAVERLVLPGDVCQCGRPQGQRGSTGRLPRPGPSRVHRRDGPLSAGPYRAAGAFHTPHFEDLAIADAAEDIQGYLDMLTNWYVRRSRDRFWEGDEQAIDVLSTCLETLVRVAAPLLPMVTEEIWQQLTGGRSVHLTDWPQD